MFPSVQINIDPIKVDIAIKNIIGNAFKYSFPKTTISISSNINNDFILIDIPTSSSDSAGPTAGSNAINSQGIFINTAAHSITGDNPFQVDVDMLFRSIKIRIRDSVPVYP